MRYKWTWSSGGLTDTNHTIQKKYEKKTENMYLGSISHYEDQIRELNRHLDSWHKHYREHWVPKENWVVVGSDGFAWRVVSEFGTNQNAADDYFLHCVEHASSEKGPLKIFRLEKRVGAVQVAEEIEMEAQSWEKGS